MGKNETLARIHENINEVVRRAESAANQAIDAVTTDFDLGEFRNNQNGEVEQIAFIGSVYDLNPSGAAYGPWTHHNVSPQDIARDTIFWESFAQELRKKDVYYFMDPVNGEHIYAARVLSSTEVSAIPSGVEFVEFHYPKEEAETEVDEDIEMEANGE